MLPGRSWGPACQLGISRQFPLPLGFGGRCRSRFHQTSPGHMQLLPLSLWDSLLRLIKPERAVWLQPSESEGGDPAESQGEMTRQGHGN